MSEIYSALNGEGVHVGVPVMIVRTQGCNLHCDWCDTKHAQNCEDGLEISVDNIINKTNHWPHWVMLTGGEPLLQPGEVHELVRKLKHMSVNVEVETNGSIVPPSWWREVSCWSADIKCPSSGMCGMSKLEWLGARDQDQIKFVVADREDLEFAHKTFMHVDRISSTILISPVWPWTNVWLRECVKFCLQHGVRLSMQQHKEIFGNERGV